MKIQFSGFILVLLVGLAFGRSLTLEQASVRNPEIKKIRTNATGKLKEWSEFLLSEMPTIDLVSIKADSFLEDLKTLATVMDSVPWAEEIPKEYFLRYVLPLRISQEPTEYFRKSYMPELFDRIRDCDDLQCAVLRINEWTYEKMKYESTSRWDQSAEQTIIRGIGRCEEMAILFVKACRAVGIPVRKAYTPYWPFTNSNHAWVEVWTGEGWHFLGGAEMTALDGAWFARAVKRTPIIVGIAWGKMDSAEVPIYLARDGFTLLNLTPNYSDTTGIDIHVENAEGLPAESVDVWISVFNYSSIRAVAHKSTDKNGFVHFALGKAELFVSAGIESLWDFKIVPFDDGDDFKKIELKLHYQPLTDTMFWMRVRKEVEVEKDTTYKAPEISKLRHDLRLEKLKGVKKDIASVFDDTTFAACFLDIMNRSRGNRNNLLAFWESNSEEKDDILDFWEAMETKDLLIPDSTGWEELWANVKSQRELSLEKDYEDSLFWDYVANPRILFEDFGYWYSSVWQKFSKFAGDKPSKCAKKIKKFIQNDIDTLRDRNYFGGMMNPEQLLIAGTGGKLERLALAAAGLRTLGIPARIAWDYKGVEYFEKDEWQRIELEKEEKEEERRTGYMKALFYDNEPKTDVEYYTDYSIIKVDDGRITGITPPEEVVDSFLVYTDIPEGNYAVISGWRNAYGEAFVKVNAFEISEDETSNVFIKLGFPPIEMISPGDLLVRKFKEPNIEDVSDINGESLKNEDWNNGNVLLAFFDTESENSISTIKLLSKLPINKLLFVETEEFSRAVDFCNEIELEGRIFTGDIDYFKKILPISKLPSILLLHNGKAILWVEGLNLNIDKLIESVSSN